MRIFAKLGRFSQKSENFRKNLEIFAKIWKCSQKSSNFRKNRQIFANICKFVIFEFSGSRPTSQFKNPKIFEFSRMPPKPIRVNFRSSFRCHIIMGTPPKVRRILGNPQKELNTILLLALCTQNCKLKVALFVWFSHEKTLLKPLTPKS